MGTTNQTRASGWNGAEDFRSENLRDSEMMVHLMDALQAGEDIGEYGRLTFAMVARHFMAEDELVDLLANNLGEEGARALVKQVEAHGYNPPRRERILAWQEQQDFPICPNPEDPNACNVYTELRFPEEIYEKIGDFWQGVSDAEEPAE